MKVKPPASAASGPAAGASPALGCASACQLGGVCLAPDSQGPMLGNHA